MTMPPRALFLAATPLHTFFALGLMHGPYRGQAHTLALVDQPAGARDLLGEALQEGGEGALTRAAPTSVTRLLLGDAGGTIFAAACPSEARRRSAPPAPPRSRHSVGTKTR